MAQERLLTKAGHRAEWLIGQMKLPFNLFDVFLVVVLVAGVSHGWKNGLSRELPALVKWLAVLAGGAIIHQPAGLAVAEAGFFDPTSACLMAYLGTALAIFFVTSVAERKWFPKLAGSDFFGRSEYFLGMGSGMLRSACILLMGLALLNAREFTPAEVRARQSYQVEAYGSNIFPGLHNLQDAVFKQSLTGTWIKEDLSFLLIDTSDVRAN